MTDQRHGRQAEGWFGYTLNDPGRQARVLRVTYSARDAGNAFRILVNGHKLADVELADRPGMTFYEEDYPIPWEWVISAEDGRLDLRFEAQPGSYAGGIYGIRLLREQP